MSGSRSIRAIALVAITVLAVIWMRPVRSPLSAQVAKPAPATPIDTQSTAASSHSPTLVPTPTVVPTITPSPMPTMTPRTQPAPPVWVGEVEYGELLSDSLFLHSPSVLNFHVQSFLDANPGPLKDYHEKLDGRTLSAADSIAFNAINFGINPQFLLLVLEAQGNLISDPGAQVPLRLIRSDWPGFYTYVRWLAWSALTAYNGARFFELDAQLRLEDDTIVALPQGLNPGTISVQATLAKVLPASRWAAWVQGADPHFRQLYRDWFGNPFAAPDAPQQMPVVPESFMLPFTAGETWYLTGGPHAYDSSGTRPWCSLDFAPPDNAWCPNGQTPLDRWIVSVDDGIVIEATEALVVIDHGNGWRTYYSHIAAQDRVERWKSVRRGEPIGHPSCEVEPGGSTNGVHVHFAVWHAGLGFIDISGSMFSGWMVEETRHYNGTLTRDGVVKTAEDSRINGRNDVLNPASSGILEP